MIDPANPDYRNTPASRERAPFGYAPINSLDPPGVTIVTPFYNTGAIFLETACSVLRQSLQQWEWLIVNDGSTDSESLALLAPYRQNDPRIRVIDHSSNRGLSAARNTGFAAARAPYVVQLDSDDLLEPTAAEKWAWFLESYPEFAFVKGYTAHFGALERLWRNGFHDGSAFLEDNLASPTSAIRVSVHGAVGGYDESNRGGLEDWDFWLRCANAGHWGGSTPEYLDWYRWRPRHAARWTNWDTGPRQRAFQAGFRRRYPRLWNGGFPQLTLTEKPRYESEPSLAWTNVLEKDKPRLLVFLDELREHAAQLVVMIQQARQAGWEVSVVSAWADELTTLARYARLTPDVFTLSHFLRARDYPRFLYYFMAARQIDVVVNAGGEFAALALAELRSRFPHAAYIRVWETAPTAVRQSPSLTDEVALRLCDLHGVTTPEASAWLAARGVDVACAPLGSEGPGFLQLLQEARLKRGERPSRGSEQLVSRLSTALAVETAQREAHTRRIQSRERELQPQLLDARSASWRTFAYFAVRRLAIPYYRTMPERWKRWLLPLTARIKQALAR